MLTVIICCLLIGAFLVLGIVGIRLLGAVYTRRFKKNVHTHLDELPRKTPAPETPESLSVVVLDEILGKTQEPKMAALGYDSEKVRSYLANLPPPRYSECVLPVIQEEDLPDSPPPEYVVVRHI